VPLPVTLAAPVAPVALLRRQLCYDVGGNCRIKVVRYSPEMCGVHDIYHVFCFFFGKIACCGRPHPTVFKSCCPHSFIHTTRRSPSGCRCAIELRFRLGACINPYSDNRVLFEKFKCRRCTRFQRETILRRFRSVSCDRARVLRL
jgi:hypothetical protein